MAGIYYSEGKGLTLEKFAEAVKPKPTQMGNNYPKFDNNIPVNVGNNDYYLFTYQDNVYAIGISIIGVVYFISIPNYKKDITPAENIDSRSSLLRTGVGMPTSVLNGVLYLLLEILKKDKPPKFLFSGNDRGLDKFYDRLMKNSAFMSELSKIGYAFFTKRNGNFIFIRNEISERKTFRQLLEGAKVSHWGFFVEGRRYEFQEFLLSEAVRPTPTKYGTNQPNFDNMEIVVDSHAVYTASIMDGNTYAIYMNRTTGETGFSFVKEIDKDKTLFNNIIKFASEEPTGFGAANNIFNQVFFIMLQVIKKSGNKTVKFSGHNNRLDKFYSFLIRNKTFLKHIKDAGYTLISSEGNNYIFSREL